MNRTPVKIYRAHKNSLKTATEWGRIMTETVFTKIMSGAIPHAKVYESDAAYAFMDAGQVNPGHVIVASKRPAETLLDLTAGEASDIFAAVHKIATAVQAAFQPEGMTILQANKPAGWQTVPHFHVHVLPRHADDGVGLQWPRKDPDLAELQELAEKITIE